ncbi:hypothetical protein Zmor_015353 [Zophobas morio]|uniref:Uncharacterized protein n=1 Tax=Zophobas morio TaxID=2755281 RepID=A0AA38IGU9_9CUCU|nr:hypothetical protein Zmor_015353 [Zophobas morio]
MQKGERPIILQSGNPRLCRSPNKTKVLNPHRLLAVVFNALLIYLFIYNFLASQTRSFTYLLAIILLHRPINNYKLKKNSTTFAFSETASPSTVFYTTTESWTDLSQTCARFRMPLQTGGLDATGKTPLGGCDDLQEIQHRT